MSVPRLLPYGQTPFDKVKKRNGDSALLSFSAGRDALAAALALREHYEEVVPFYMYLVPGLTFVEESLDYYERKLFGRPVLRVPHPSFLRWTKMHLFSDPVKAAIVDEREIPLLSFTDLEVMVRQEEDLDPDCLVATGVRAEDGPIRMMALRKYGPITLSKKKWHPIWDWSKTEVVHAIAKAGLKLSGEYAWMKRSFDGIHVGYGADQAERAGRQSEDPRLVSVRRGGGFAARKGRIAMTSREMVGWGLVAGAGVCAVLAALVKDGTFEALTAASASLAGAAGMWGYTNKPKV